MIHLKNIYFDYTGIPIFEDANLSIYRADRIGIVGKNGSGKTTLLNIISGNLEITKGQIIKEGNIKIGAIPQEIYFDKSETPFSLAKKAFEKEISLIKQFENISEKLEKEPDSKKLHEKYDLLLNEIEKLDAFNFDYKIKRILYAMGFSQQEFEKELNKASGGFKVRAYIAYLLLLKPDLLLLDEPTNYLDIDSRIFLTGFLKNYNKAYIIISHDKYFLNEVVDKIVHVANKKLFTYTSSNYDEFEKKKELLLKQAYEFEKNKQKLVKQLERFIDRFRAKKNFSSRVKNKIKQVERIKNQTIEIPQEKDINFSLKSSGKKFSNIISFTNVSFGYKSNYDDLENNIDNLLLKNITFSIIRGQKIVLMGKNGIGKTTLLKLANNILKPTSGEIIIHNNSTIGYFAQNIIEQLDFEKSVLDEFSESKNTQNMTEGQKRTLLGVFGFSNEDVFKKVKVLSGGEKVRLIISKIFVNEPDILILDEPTTHIDITTKEVLKESLRNFDGAILTVSHDIDFIKSVGEEFWTIENKNLVFLKSFEEYLNLFHKKDNINNNKILTLKNKKKEYITDKVDINIINQDYKKRNYIDDINKKSNNSLINKTNIKNRKPKNNVSEINNKNSTNNNLDNINIFNNTNSSTTFNSNTNNKDKILSKNEIFRKRKELELIENEILQIEETLKKITKEMSEQKDFTVLNNLKTKYEELQTVLKEKENIYFELSELLEPYI